MSKSILDRKVYELELTVRAGNQIEKMGIDTIGDLVSKTEDDLTEGGVSKVSVNEIKDRLSEYGLALRVPSITEKYMVMDTGYTTYCAYCNKDTSHYGTKYCPSGGINYTCQECNGEVSDEYMEMQQMPKTIWDVEAEEIRKKEKRVRSIYDCLKALASFEWFSEYSLVEIEGIIGDIERKIVSEFGIETFKSLHNAKSFEEFWQEKFEEENDPEFDDLPEMTEEMKGM